MSQRFVVQRDKNTALLDDLAILISKVKKFQSVDGNIGVTANELKAYIVSPNKLYLEVIGDVAIDGYLKSKKRICRITGKRRSAYSITRKGGMYLDYAVSNQ